MFFLLFVLLFFPIQSYATVLSNTAATLAVNSFVRVDTSMNNWGGGSILIPSGCGSGDTITQYANKAVWNSVQRRFQFSGSPHSACSGSNEKAVYYNDTTDTWGVLPTPPGSGNDPRHSYDHNTIDPFTGEHYYTFYNSGNLLRLNSAGTTWTSLATRSGNYQCCRAQAYFPDKGGLVHVDGDWGVRFWTRSSNTWKQLSQGNGSDGSGLPKFTGDAQPAFAEYSRRCQCVVFGGGTNFRKLNQDFTFTALSTTNGPASGILNVGPGNSSITVDPVSGFLIVINGTTMWQFDPGLTPANTGSWSKVNTTIPAFFQTAGSTAESLISAPISTYGVIMYVKHDDSSSGQVYLYKHTPTTKQDLDFFARREGAGTLRWFDFDTPNDYPDYDPGAGHNRCWGCNYGVGPNGGATNIPTLDTSVVASGAGSMKFTQPAGGGASAAGNWFTNLTPDKSYALNAGDEVYIQYRVRLSPALLNNSNWPGSDGFKTSDFSAGDTAACSTTSPNTTECPGSCTEVEIVQQNAGKKGFPQAYAGCSGPESFSGFYKHTAGNMDSHPNYTGSPARACYYPGPYTEPHCLNYVANEWMTIQIYVKVGTWKTYSSTFKMWVARDGQPSQLIIHCGPGVTCGTKTGGDTSTGLYFHNNSNNSLRLGKLWLLPYQTNLTSGLVDANMWFDELIIARSQIPDPGFASGPPAAPPNAPGNLRPQ